MRAAMRGKDHLGRFSGNKFGIILNNCTPDDMLIAADRLLAGVRDEVVQTAAGPVAVTVTIGGVTAPRHARNVHEVLARAQDALDGAKAKRRGSFQAYRPNLEREALRRENVRATDEIVTALNERRIFLAFEPVVAIGSRQPAFYECLMRIRRADGSLVAANDVIPARGAARPGAPARSPRARARGGGADRGAGAQGEPQRLGGLDHRSGLVGGARRACCARIRASPSGSPSRSPRRRRSRTSTRRAASSPASRISAAASPSTISAPATPRSATCASSASTSSRSTAPSCRTSCARRTTAPSCTR